MRNTTYFQNKKITVVGLARSGLSCANLLYDLGAKVSVTDNSDNELTRLNALKLKSKDIPVELGGHCEEFIKGRDIIVVSPGVLDTALPVVWAQQYKIPVVSEIEIAWVLCPATVIAVSGTNGKTTVTTLIARILEAAGKKVFVCGNIGNPFCGELEKIKEGDYISLEVSSFQLERIRSFKPKIAVILNFTCNHLDRYSDLKEYLQAKKRIFMNQDKSDYLVLNAADPAVKELAKEAAAFIVYFSQQEGLNPNQQAGLAVASILGIDNTLALEVFKNFKGVEHRLEYVNEINQVKFINDSKSTTVDSTIWALKSIAEPVILIAGGRDKGNDYTTISDLMRGKVKELVVIGESKEKLKGAFKKYLSIHEASSLEEATRIAFSIAKPGDCVLLSPMCASFDMFANYEERGRVFKQAVCCVISD